MHSSSPDFAGKRANLGRHSDVGEVVVVVQSVGRAPVLRHPTQAEEREPSFCRDFGDYDDVLSRAVVEPLHGIRISRDRSQLDWAQSAECRGVRHHR